MSKVLNFDQFMQEKNDEKITVKVFGKDYQIPCQIPAIVPVMMARSEESLDNKASTFMIMRAADIVFGKENVDEMCAAGMSGRDLAVLMQKVFSMINGDEDDDEAQELSDEGETRRVKSKSAKK